MQKIKQGDMMMFFYEDDVPEGKILFQYKIKVTRGDLQASSLGINVDAVKQEHPNLAHFLSGASQAIDEEEYESRLTPRGTNFLDHDEMTYYNDKINEYNETITTLENLNIEFEALSLSEAQDAQGLTVLPGPHRNLAKI